MNGIGTILDQTNFGLSTPEEATISDDFVRKSWLTYGHERLF